LTRRISARAAALVGKGSKAQATRRLFLEIIEGVRRVAYDLPAELAAYFAQGTRVGIAKNYDIFRLKGHDEICIVTPERNQPLFCSGSRMSASLMPVESKPTRWTWNGGASLGFKFAVDLCGGTFHSMRCERTAIVAGGRTFIDLGGASI
jgi:hypothetical protein